MAVKNLTCYSLCLGAGSPFIPSPLMGVGLGGGDYSIVSPSFQSLPNRWQSDPPINGGDGHFIFIRKRERNSTRINPIEKL
jgi:hypothetical protein